jgi:hypothetical protein
MGQTGVVFTTFILVAPWRVLTGGCKGGLLEFSDFRQGREVCRVCFVCPIVFARLARQNGPNRGFCSTKSAKFASCTLSAHF